MSSAIFLPSSCLRRYAVSACSRAGATFESSSSHLTWSKGAAITSSEESQSELSRPPPFSLLSFPLLSKTDRQGSRAPPMDVQDYSEERSTPHATLAPSAVTCASASTTAHPSNVQTSQPHSPSPPSSPVEIMQDSSRPTCSERAQGEAAEREDEVARAEGSGWSSWGSPGDRGFSSYTPPSSYTPSIPFVPSRSPEKGKERQQSPVELAESLVHAQSEERLSSKDSEGDAWSREYVGNNPREEIGGLESREEQERTSASHAGALSAEAPATSSPSSSASPSSLPAPINSVPISSPPTPSSAADDPTPSSPKRKRTLSLPRALRRPSRELSSPSTPALSSSTVNLSAPSPNRFTRSLSSLSTTSRPSSFFALTPASTTTAPDPSTPPAPGRRRSKSGLRMMKALSYIRPSTKEAHPEPVPSLPPTPSIPTRPRSQSAPLLRNFVTPVQSLDDHDPPSPFVTALSSPTSETPPRVATPVQLRLNLFDFLLPREVRLKIMEMLLESCVDEHEKEVQGGSWRGDRARERWVGEVKGRRELVRISRVSLSCHNLPPSVHRLC